jgi:hypothetical protein
MSLHVTRVSKLAGWPSLVDHRCFLLTLAAGPGWRRVDFLRADSTMFSM